MNSPDLQTAFTCDVCSENRIENAFNVNHRHEEFNWRGDKRRVCRECSTGARAFAIGVVVDSVTRPVDPYARTVIDFGVVNMYRPPTHRSRNWLGLFIAVVLVIGAVVAVGRVWG